MSAAERDFTKATTFSAEGSRVGIVVCNTCGAAILIDPRDDVNRPGQHAAWHQNNEPEAVEYVRREKADALFEMLADLCPKLEDEVVQEEVEALLDSYREGTAGKDRNGFPDPQTTEGEPRQSEPPERQL